MMQIYRLVIDGKTFEFGPNLLKALEEIIGTMPLFATLKRTRRVVIENSELLQLRTILNAVDHASLSTLVRSDWVGGELVHRTAFSLLMTLREHVGLKANPAA
ncbi:MAG TPA: hypothetical protein VFO38_00185 [Candidatus Saccharimonadales bacterium]|nr:hypothetical protein [Candidatus Saccharimonadales bacterium]